MNHPTGEVAPETSPTPQQPVDVMTIAARDIWHSFLFSRGDISTQDYLTKLEADQYHAWPAEQHAELVGRLGEIGAATRDLREPGRGRHVVIDDNAREKQLSQQLRRFDRYVRRGPLSPRQRRYIGGMARLDKRLPACAVGLH